MKKKSSFFYSYKGKFFTNISIHHHILASKFESSLPGLRKSFPLVVVVAAAAAIAIVPTIAIIVVVDAAANTVGSGLE